MALADIAREKIERLDSVPNQFISAVDKSQNEIWRWILGELDTLETDAGKILLNNGNLARIEQIVNQLEQVVFDSSYLDAAVDFASEFKVQKGLNDDYFAELLGQRFQTKELYTAIARQSQRDALTLLSDTAVRQEFIEPLKQILNGTVSGEMTQVQAVDIVRDYVLGNAQVDGRLLRYSKQVARDAFSISDRRYTRVVADDIGMVWFKYQGGTVNDSREFCVQRAEEIFHKSEVESWGNIQQWQGRIRGTNSSNIFEFAGGYNCMHSILPVSESDVPPEKLEQYANTRQ